MRVAPALWRAAWLALAVALGALPGQRPASAQEAVRSAHLVADLTAADGSAVVRIEYTVAGAAPGTPIEASALDFRPATVEDVRTGAGDASVPLTRGIGLARAATLRVEPGDGAGSVSVAYRVANAMVERSGSVRGHIPVLGLDRPPEHTRPDLFDAEVRLPPHWKVVEGFPTGLAATGEPGVYRVQLAVVPALVSFRGRSDGAWRPGLPVALDALALALLLGFAVVGWRHFGGADA